ncbi:MAG: alternative ribosome rescue aminoacyl-tRNA hydrolase ArfB [Acidobacteriota bacterium]
MSSGDELEVTSEITLRERDITESFTRASGPGGQKVNKSSVAVQLRFDLEGSDLPEEVKERLRVLARGRLDADGQIIIRARRFRSLEQNRRDARVRLCKLVRRATQRRKARVLRRGESRRAKTRRVDAKRRRSDTKRLRQRPARDD